MQINSVLIYEKKRYSTPDQRAVDLRERKLLTKILMGLDTFDKVLDIPCGYGRMYYVLKERSRLYTGSDVSKEMVLRLKSRSGVGKGVVGNIYSLPFKDESFEMVLSWRIFQHINTREKREKAFSELSRVSKRWVLISFYRENTLHKIERILTGRKSKINMMRVKEILDEAQRAGLGKILIMPLFPLFHSQTLLLLKKK